MGITIHYDAKVKEKDISKIDNYMKNLAVKLKLPKGDYGTANKAEELRVFNGVYSDQYGKATDVKGRWLVPHEGCEAVSMLFFKTPKGWILDNFTKTQYGGLAGHLITCSILEDLKAKYLKSMKIYDEAEYCGKEKKDLNKLKENFEESALMIDAIAGKLREAGFKDDQIVSGGEMAIREAKRKKLRGVV
jgi:hypothetical protein